MAKTPALHQKLCCFWLGNRWSSAAATTGSKTNTCSLRTFPM